MGGVWDDLAEEFEPFALDLLCDRCQPRDVPTRLCEARDESRRHGVADGNHDKRAGRRRSLDRMGRGSTRGDDELDFASEQLRDEGRKTAAPFNPCRRAVVGHHRKATAPTLVGTPFEATSRICR
jgi:hypothetical protein